MPEQITLFDERYYKVAGRYLPSVTWILNSYPKDIFFNKWLANHGWEESERIKDEAMDRGSKVHNAIEDLLGGTEITYGAPYWSKKIQDNVALSDNEWKHLMTWKAWWDQAGYRLVAPERTVWSLEKGYAGTVDAILMDSDDNLVVADWKTSSAIFPTYLMQVSAYAMAIEEMVPDLEGRVARVLVVRTGTRHACGYETASADREEMGNKFGQFLSVRSVWAIEHGSKSPVNRTIPQSLSVKVETVDIDLGSEEEEGGEL